MRLLLVALATGCGSPEVSPEAPAPEVAEDAYTTAIKATWKERDDRLATERGWLTLVGLSWLEEGDTVIGSTEDAGVPLPDWSAPATLGKLTRTGTEVRFTPADGVEVSDEEAVLTEAVTLLADAHEDGPTVLTHKTLTFYVIERQGKIGIRAKDSAHPDRTAFTGVPHFDVDAAFKVSATLERYDEPRPLQFPTAIGTTEEALVPGVLTFELNGATHTLLPFQDAPDEEMFIVFADGTSGIETYGAGRFLGAPAADSDGKVELDFNTATNPPCAFTPFATCPLPPSENRLSARVEAGEKTPAGH
ncbi:MAG: DUF1684 domain-containing protein [Proteobacteria bacterium]|nr:DUF1684 domain-containing protein [Pseudomonadota bacterium]